MLVARGIGVACQGLLAVEPKLWLITWVMVPIILFRIGAPVPCNLLMMRVSLAAASHD